jgi:hypothetical protein
MMPKLYIIIKICGHRQEIGAFNINITKMKREDRPQREKDIG